MLRNTRAWMVLLVLSLVHAGAVLSAGAEWRPDRPVRLLLPFAPGGGADAVARVLTPKLHESLGQPWVFDNRGGAGGNIAADIVAHSNPDGQTVFLGFSTVLTVNPLLYKLGFDMMKDLIPVCMINAGQYMLVLHPSVKADSVNDLIALGKSKSTALSYGSAGIGTPLHLAAELFKTRTGAAMNHIPYKGGGPASIAVLAGEVQVLFGSLPSVLPHVRTGKLKALAVTSARRAQVAPEIPTLIESGLPGYEVVSWYGIFLPGKTPEAIVRAMEDHTAAALALPDVREGIQKQGLEVAIKRRKEFSEQIRRETETWAQVIKAANIKAE